MATNNFLPFCPTTTGTNLLTQSEYAAAADRDDGNQPGIASSKLNNKALRQASAIVSQIAQMVSDNTGADMLDTDSVEATLLANMKQGLASPYNQGVIQNLSLAASVGTSALTVTVKTQAGSNASAASPILVGFRSATLTTGSANLRTISAALSMIISSGSTLGQTDGNPSNIYVYLIDNAGTPELAVSHSIYPENALVTTVAEGGSGGADSATVIYSTTSRSNVPLRLIGYMTNTQTTAGTWASTPTQIQLLPTVGYIAPTVQRITSGSSTYVTPVGVKYIRVKCLGGGGGGGGSNTVNSVSGGTGTSGSNTTFGTSLITASGGGGGANPGTGSAGAGGSLGSVNSPAVTVNITVGSGGNPAAAMNSGGTAAQPSGSGGTSTVGGGASGITGTTGTGNSASANSGSGGGGAGTTQGTFQNPGHGGGSGSYAEAIISNPLSTYAYSVGAGGSGGTAGSSGAVGGAGGSGVIIIEEYYH